VTLELVGQISGLRLAGCFVHSDFDAFEPHSFDQWQVAASLLAGRHFSEDIFRAGIEDPASKGIAQLHSTSS
jgi:hypothetical protein